MLIQPEPSYQPNTDTLEVTHVGIHSNLALAVSKTKDANVQRAFPIWASKRSELDWIYTKAEMERSAQKTGKCGLTLNRWLKAGEGIFWFKAYSKRHGKECYYMHGKDKVFKYFGLANPGRVLTINIEDLFDPKLTRLRANLKDFAIVNECKWASRTTLTKLTGVERRTQQNYDKESRIGRQYTTVNRTWTTEDGKRYNTKQMPNIYHARFLPFYQKSNHKRYGLYTSDFNAKDDSREAKLDLFAGRLAYDDKEAAEIKAAWFAEMGIKKDVFYKDSITKAGNILWKVIEYKETDLLSLAAECIGL